MSFSIDRRWVFRRTLFGWSVLLAGGPEIARFRGPFAAERALLYVDRIDQSGERGRAAASG